MLALEESSNLENLGLAFTAVGDSGLDHLKLLKRLTRLSLESTRVTDAGLAHLAGLKNLQVLFLSGTNVGDEGIAHLRGLAQLKNLSLAYTRITDAGCEHLAQLKKLEILSIASTPITNEGISLLGDLRKLRALSLVGTRVTEGGLGKLKRAIPRCAVKTDAGTVDVVDSELKARAELERIGARVRLDDRGRGAGGQSGQRGRLRRQGSGKPPMDDRLEATEFERLERQRCRPGASQWAHQD